MLLAKDCSNEEFVQILFRLNASLLHFPEVSCPGGSVQKIQKEVALTPRHPLTMLWSEVNL